jgi:hypothetical protein
MSQTDTNRINVARPAGVSAYRRPSRCTPDVWDHQSNTRRSALLTRRLAARWWRLFPTSTACVTETLTSSIWPWRSPSEGRVSIWIKGCHKNDSSSSKRRFFRDKFRILTQATERKIIPCHPYSKALQSGWYTTRAVVGGWGVAVLEARRPSSMGLLSVVLV